ncbi:baseplate wedge protein [Synechococcus phage S-MS29]|nr:baseplate wedge protein [Synechococcus phage S-MS29]
MQPKNLTALDFDDIKSSIKAYLRTRDEFTDYDFEGSSLSYLIDILAYNTYYTAFTANMSMNEAFLETATVRDNVVNQAKLLNYTPTSIKASYAYLHITVQTNLTNDVYPNSVTLQSGPVATGGNYVWNILEPITQTVNQTTGQATFRCVKVYEGSIVNYSYTVNKFIKQVFTIPTSEADVTTLSVRVKANASSTTSDVYNLVDNVTTVTATDRVYFLTEGEDMRYEVQFGDGVIGRDLGDGEVIDLSYLVTKGAEANGINKFSFVGRFVDSNSVTYAAANVAFEIAEKSNFGSAAESLESIKYLAPRFYSAQYRAVTAQDYEVITKKLYDNAKTVVAYGGDELNPPVYGKVYVAIKTKTGSKLNDATKKSLATQLRSYSMASIESVVVDADTMYVYPKVFLQYDPACSGRAVSAIGTKAQAAAADWASTSGINNFGQSFSLGNFERAIVNSDRCITDSSTQIALLKYITPTPVETNTYCITVGQPLYDSGSGDDQDSSCPKAPILRSGNFRLLDLPGVDQYFEDDGYGNLKTYYNSGNRKVYTNENAGTVDYANGEVCFGPAAVVGAGGNNLPSITGADFDADAGANDVDVTDTAVDDLGDLRIPVLLIPSNNSTIDVGSPNSTIEIITPTISVTPIGTELPSNIPINSLTPMDFNTVPSTIDIPDITLPGDLANTTCF